MKPIHFLLYLLVVCSCSESVYPIKNFNEGTKAIYSEVFESKKDLAPSSFCMSRFEMCYCEVPVRDVLKRELTTKDQCKGQVFESHHIDIYEYRYPDQNDTTVVLYTAKIDGGNIIGSCRLFTGKRQYSTAIKKDVIILDQKYIYKKGKKDEGYILKPKGEVDLRLIFEEKDTTDVRNKSRRILYVTDVHNRKPNKVGGSEPISFDLKGMFQGAIPFEKVCY